MITWETVLRWVAGQARESEQLEFKRQCWQNGRSGAVEIAKDVASMMNHMGGTIAVGLHDTHDRCSGFSNELNIPKKGLEQLVVTAVVNHTVPAEAAQGVHVRPVAGRDVDGVERTVWLVQVDAWPHGPVAVHAHQDWRYRIPVRVETHTKELPWEEAMRRLDGAHRRTWLRFKEWERRVDGPLGFYVQSVVYAVSPNGEGARMLMLSPDKPFAHVRKVDQDGVHLDVLVSQYADGVAAGQSFEVAGRAPKIPVPWTLPFELIKHVWFDQTGPAPRVQALLRIPLLRAHGQWHMVDRPGDIWRTDEVGSAWSRVLGFWGF